MKTGLLLIAHGSRQEDANADPRHVAAELRARGWPTSASPVPRRRGREWGRLVAKQTEEAIAEMSEALRLDPTNTEVYDKRGNLR